MSEIQRYKFDELDDLTPCADGWIVDYDDHKAILDGLKGKIEAVEARNLCKMGTIEQLQAKITELERKYENLEKILDHTTNIGIYPMSISGGPNAYEKRSEWQEGWNACASNTIAVYVRASKGDFTDVDREDLVYVKDVNSMSAKISDLELELERTRQACTLNTQGWTEAAGTIVELQQLLAAKEFGLWTLQSQQMTEERARGILEGYITPKGELRSWRMDASFDGECSFCEDENFTADELEAIAWWMRNKGVK